jgi:hypothetical protein
MMVTSPSAYVERFAEAGATRYYFHIEAEPYPSRLCEQIRAAGMTPGIALNPVYVCGTSCLFGRGSYEDEVRELRTALGER